MTTCEHVNQAVQFMYDCMCLKKYYMYLIVGTHSDYNLKKSIVYNCINYGQSSHMYELNHKSNFKQLLFCAFELQYKEHKGLAHFNSKICHLCVACICWLTHRNHFFVTRRSVHLALYFCQ